MRYMVAFFLFASFAVAGNAQVITLADVKAKGAVQLSAQELKQLVPAAKVVSRTNKGSTRYWENKTDGTLVASSDNAGNVGHARPNSGSGTWHVSDEGSYCVSIEWNRAPEKWCRHIFKMGDRYYGVPKVEDSAAAYEFEFSK